MRKKFLSSDPYQAVQAQNYAYETVPQDNWSAEKLFANQIHFKTIGGEKAPLVMPNNVQLKDKLIMIPQRGEIAIRGIKAAKALGLRILLVHWDEDSESVSTRYVDKDKGDILVRFEGSGYEDQGAMEAIIKQFKPDFCFPGYGFLSEKPSFSQLCKTNNVAFVGPGPEPMAMFGDKHAAIRRAEQCGVKVNPHTQSMSCKVEDFGANIQQLKDFFFKHKNADGFRIMLKSQGGGGGYGQFVLNEEHFADPGLAEKIQVAMAYDDFYAELFIVGKNNNGTKHFEVQALVDNVGNITFLGVRDCSIQYKHQKRLEIADNVEHPLFPKLKDFAARMIKGSGYVGALTLEFLDDMFLEVNPRCQVEHTVTEEATGVDIIKSMIAVSAGANLRELGLPEDIQPKYAAIQTRVTGEVHGKNGFTPSPGYVVKVDLPQNPAFNDHVRLDGILEAGSTFDPGYAPLLSKITVRAESVKEAMDIAAKYLDGIDISLSDPGSGTNIPFMVQLLQNETVRNLGATSRWLHSAEAEPLFAVSQAQLLKKAEDQSVVGSLNCMIKFAVEKPHQGAVFIDPSAPMAVNKQAATIAEQFYTTRPVPKEPTLPTVQECRTAVDLALKNVEAMKMMTQSLAILNDFGVDNWGSLLRGNSVKAWQTCVNKHHEQGLPLYTDTTYRDMFQSKFGTRMRVNELLTIAKVTKTMMQMLQEKLETKTVPTFGLISGIEAYGGATFQSALRFVFEEPTERLDALHKILPETPIQALIRDLNIVRYKVNAVNKVAQFIGYSHALGMDRGRMFDALNKVEVMNLASHIVQSTETKRPEDFSVDNLDNLAKLEPIPAEKRHIINEQAITFHQDRVADPKQKLFTVQYFCELAVQLAKGGADLITVKDPAGILLPEKLAKSQRYQEKNYIYAKELFSALRKTLDDAGFKHLPLWYHGHDTGGWCAAVNYEALQHGCAGVDVCSTAMGGDTGQTTFKAMDEEFRRHEQPSGLNLALYQPFERYLGELAEVMLPFCPKLPEETRLTLLEHQMPGGQAINLYMNEVIKGTALNWLTLLLDYEVADYVGGGKHGLVKVTPSSNAVAYIATMIKDQIVPKLGNREAFDALPPQKRAEIVLGYLKENVEDENAVSVHENVRDFLQGAMSVPTQGFDHIAAVQSAVLKRYQLEPVDNTRPLPPYNFALNVDKLRQKYPDKTITMDDVLSDSLFPEDHADREKLLKDTGNPRKLTTRQFIYGLIPGEETRILVDENTNKTVTVKLLSISKPDEKTGNRAYTFLWDGIVSKLFRGQAPAFLAKDVEGGMGYNQRLKISKCCVQAGQDVNKGDVIFEVMIGKDEKTLTAPYDGFIGKIYVEDGEETRVENQVLYSLFPVESKDK